MKHLTILVPEVQNNVITIAAAYEIFASANAYWKETGRKELFTIELAGISEKVDFQGGLFTAKATCQHLSYNQNQSRSLFLQ